MAFTVIGAALLSVCVLLNTGTVTSFICLQDNPTCSGNGDSSTHPNGCNPTSGVCTCDSTHNLVYDCSIANADITCSTLTCANGGTCYTDSGTEKCFCPENYYGDTCQINLAGGGFVCRRDNPTCSGFGTCQADGSCLCADNTVQRGFDCGLVTAQAAAGTCAAETCNNHGTCYDPGSGAVCYCDYYYWTDSSNCDTPRIEEEPQCGADEMTLKIVPYPTKAYPGSATFSGSMYIFSDEAGSTTCTVSVTSGEGDYTVKYADCSTAIATNALDATATDYTNYLIVQFFTNFKHEYDLRTTVTCTLSDTNEATGTVTTTTISGTEYTQHSRTAVVNPPLVSEFVDSAGASTTVNAKAVGDDIYLKVSLSSTGVYSKIKIESAIAEDAVSSPTHTLSLIAGGCKVVAQASIVDGLTRASSSEITLKLQAFKFATTDNVVLTLVVNLCRTGFMTACDDSTTCSANGGSGVGRKRREAAEGDTKIITRTLKIIDGQLADSGQQQQEQAEADKLCSFGMETIMMLVVLGIIVLALSTVAVGLSCWIIKLRSRRSTDTKSLKI